MDFLEFMKAIPGQLGRIRLMDYLDIIAVFCLLYFAVKVLRSSGAIRIVWVVVSVLIVGWLASLMKLHTLNFILSQFTTVGLIALVVLFQPELRRMIDRLSNVKLKKLLSPQEANEQMVTVIRHTVRACEEMSKEKIGALIVFSRDSLMDEYFKTGTMIDATVSDQLLRNIFFPKAALHDGAMIIQDCRVLAAGCVLPLSETNRLSADLGTRHRAAVGMSEVTDAVIVVVSEETGAISVAVGGMLKRHLAPQTLERLLRSELCSKDQKTSKRQELIQMFRKKDKGGN